MKFTADDISIHRIQDIPVQVWHQILQLRSEVFVSEQICVYTDPDEHDRLSWHVFIQSAENPVAYARFFKDDHWKIGRIITDSSFRGKGLSRLILDRAIKEIYKVDSGANIEMSAQVYLSDFYRSMGFEIEGSMYLEDGIPHLKMVYTPSPEN